MKRLRTTIGLMMLGCCTPALSLDLPHATGIKLDNWGLTDQSTLRPSLTIGEQDWWGQAWRTYPGIDLDPLRKHEPTTAWPTGFNLAQRFFFTDYQTTFNVGIGIQPIDFSASRSHEGLRLSLGGRIGIGNGLTVYGESAWVPGLLESGMIDSASGLHFETGLMLNPLPYLSIRAAYRRYNLDYTLTGGAGEITSSQGIMIGTGIHW